jgi:hypothetical protein
MGTRGGLSKLETVPPLGLTASFDLAMIRVAVVGGGYVGGAGGVLQNKLRIFQMWRWRRGSSHVERAQTAKNVVDGSVRRTGLYHFVLVANLIKSYCVRVQWVLVDGFIRFILLQYLKE